MQKAMIRLDAKTSKKICVLSMCAWMILRSWMLEHCESRTSLGFL